MVFWSFVAIHHVVVREAADYCGLTGRVSRQVTYQRDPVPFLGT